MSKPKVLILGGTGFIGRNLVERYSREGLFELRAPRRAELDLLDTAAVEDYCLREKPDVVVLVAVNIQSLEENLQIYYNVARSHHAYGRLITVGSGAEYDMRHYHPMLREEDFGRHIPADTYGLSKFVAARDIEQGGRDAVNLRVLGIFGEYEDYTRRFISNNICRALAGLNITLFQDMRFDYLDVQDFAQILKRFILNRPQQRNYNVSTAEPVALLTLARLIHETHGDAATQIVVRAEGMKAEYSADNRRFLDEFGPFEFTTKQASVARLYDWYARHPDLPQFCEVLRAREQAAT